MWLFKSVVFTQVFLFAAALCNVFPEVGNPCITPYRENGTCVVWDSCPAIKEAIKGFRNENSLKLYHRSTCDTDKVCCGTITFLNSSEPSNVLPPKGTCGKFVTNNADITKLPEFPWIARLGYVDENDSKIEFNCAGTLINSRYVLTAAHCIPRYKSSNEILSFVRLGERGISTEIDCENVGCQEEMCADRVLDVGIESQTSHPDYNYSLQEGPDLGLLRLEINVKYTELIQPICLTNADKSKIKIGNPMDIPNIVVAPGVKNDALHQYFLKASIAIVSIEKCLERLQLDGDLKDNEFCLGRNASFDSCKRDSGGPIMRKYEGYWYQEALISHGIKCNSYPFPATFSQVSKNYNWILDTIL